MTVSVSDDQGGASVGKKLAFLTAHTIKKMIANPVYRGVVRIRTQSADQSPDNTKDPVWEEFTGRHPAIVDEEHWFKANRLVGALDRKKLKKVREPRSGLCLGLLQGLLTCSYCDAAMSPGNGGRRRRSGARHRYYRCSQLVKGARLCDCTTRQLSADAMEAAVAMVIDSIEASPACFSRLGHDATSRTLENKLGALNAELIEIDTKIAEEKSALQNFLGFIRKNENADLNTRIAFEAEATNRRLVEHELTRVGIESRINQLAAKLPSIQELSGAFARVGRALSVANFDGKRSIFIKVLREVTLLRLGGVIEKGRSQLKNRTFRLCAEFRTNSLMEFGETVQSSIPTLNQFRNLKLTATFEIHSTKKEQKVTLLEQGYATVSSSFLPDLTAAEPTSVPARDDENPIQRAIRWKMELEKTALTASALADREGVSKGRVSQGLDLLKLPQVIVDFMRDGRDASLARPITARELERLREMPSHEAVAHFHARVGGLPIQDSLPLK